MLHITIGIDPIIVQFGSFALRWYSLAIVAAILLGTALTRRELLRQGRLPQQFDTLVLWSVIGGIVGARLFYVLDHLDVILQHPLQALAFQQGGLAIYGAVAGGFVALVLMSRAHHLPFLPLLDAIAPGLALGQAVGRLGCIVNGDAWGAPTSSPFAFIYTNPHALLPHELLGVPTHPYPVYDMALNLLVLALIWQLRKRPLPSGIIFMVFAGLYATGRFCISFVRQERVWFWGLQEAQVIALTILVAALISLVWLLRRGKSTPVQAANA